MYAERSSASHTIGQEGGIVTEQSGHGSNKSRGNPVLVACNTKQQRRQYCFTQTSTRTDHLNRSTVHILFINEVAIEIFHPADVKFPERLSEIW